MKFAVNRHAARFKFIKRRIDCIKFYRTSATHSYSLEFLKILKFHRIGGLVYAALGFVKFHGVV
ncbi:MAG: hypothetical protein HXK63_01650 [Campylobacter sp.]|nr:hypothetical protein [Campylobacter sp.]